MNHSVTPECRVVCPVGWPLTKIFLFIPAQRSRKRLSRGRQNEDFPFHVANDLTIFLRNCTGVVTVLEHDIDSAGQSER
ncbi:hypothetical protein AcV5_007637 [Taiwanofungus camphoratus]|nr:hypothetical protein AcV5_007637 [Antrodia cinnamomea]